MNALLKLLAPAHQEPARKLRLLVAVDFSQSCRRAVAVALRTARRFDVELTFVHIVPHLPHGSHPILELAGIDQDWLKPARARLATFVAKHVPLKFRRREIVLSGKPFVEICRLAQEEHYDGIVVATHGYSGLAHLAIGSTAERIVRHASCPVLVVPVQSRRNGEFGLGTPVERILMPTDFSEPSRRWLKVGGAVAREYGARALLLHVVAPLDFPGLVIPPSLLEELSPANTRRRLSEFWTADDAGVVSVEPLFAEGIPAEKICEIAERYRVDLMVMAAHGKSDWKKALMGSTSEKVARFAPCPVLIVREQAASGTLRLHTLPSVRRETTAA